MRVVGKRTRPKAWQGAEWAQARQSGEAERRSAGKADGQPRIGQRGEGGAERSGERRADGSTWSRAGQKRVEFSPSTSIESTRFAIFDTGSLVSAKNSVFGVVELRLA